MVALCQLGITDGFSVGKISTIHVKKIRLQTNETKILLLLVNIYLQKIKNVQVFLSVQSAVHCTLVISENMKGHVLRYTRAMKFC